MSIYSMNIEDFVDKDFHRPNFIVEKLVPYGGEPCILYGDPGHGKSMLANTLIKAVCDGEPFLGQFKTLQGKVAYCSFDMPIQLVQDRVRNLYSIMDCPENLWCNVSDSRINIMKASVEDEWLARTLEFEPLIVIMDTLRKIHYMDENEQMTVTKVYGKLGELFGAHTTPVLIAHQRKFSQADTQKRADQRISGHYAWVSDSDLGVQVEKNESKNPTEVTLNFTRIRHSKPVDQIITTFAEGSSTLKLHVTPMSRALQLFLRDSDITENEIVEVLLDEDLCKRSMAYRVAKKVLEK